MARIVGHGKAKYVTGQCLETSRGRAWPGLLAERWRHSEGDLGEVLPRDTEVIVMLEGSLKVRRRGDGRLQEHAAGPGTVWLCPAGIAEDMIHLYGEIRDSVHLYLPAQPLSRTCLEELDIDPSDVRLRYEGGFRDPTIESIAGAISAELRGVHPVSALLVETMAAALAVYLVRRYSDRTPEATRLPAARGSLDQGRLQRVLDMIGTSLDKDLTLDNLAKQASLSPFHFARSFKAATGTSPHRYVLERRIERARKLLEIGSLSLAEVAAACGFSSQAHFSTVFRQSAGMSPGAFRTMRRS